MNHQSLKRIITPKKPMSSELKVLVDGIKHVVFDIEGTICPISFVKDNLYTYFLNYIPSILEKFQYPLTEASAPQQTPQLDYFKIHETLLALREENPALTQSYELLLLHFQDLVRKDVKDKHLKQLQGVVWASGYASGEITVSLFPDAIGFMKKLANPQNNCKIYIYSSGSVKAQKLLLGHVKSIDSAFETTDLNPLISDYYDINTSGYKTESQSYCNIFESIKSSHDPTVKPLDILFFSDNILEIKAASKAGFKICLVEKPGNKEVTLEDKKNVTIIKSFQL